MRGATLFSGIGGVDAGMKMAGVEVVAAVECDPTRANYSQAMARSHRANFPGAAFFMRPVQEMNWQSLARLRPNVLHSSTMCSHFSPMASVHGGIEDELDRTMAIATADSIEATEPDYFSLEQAPKYLHSESFRTILERLEKLGYSVNPQVIDVARYGVPQNRRRLFVLCSRPGKPVWQLPKPSNRVVGWKEAITKVPLEECEFTERQKARSLQEDCLIQRISASKSLVVRKASEPSWAILRDHFCDHHGGIRSKVATARIGAGTYNLSIRAIARLCSFPDWFDLEPAGRYAGMGLGYAVPPLMMKKLYQQLS